MKWNKNYPDRDAKKHYFLVPNEVFTMDLNPYEIALYDYLLFREDRKTFECYSKMSSIAKAIGVKSRNTVAKTINSLVDKSFITVENTIVESKNGRLQNGCLRFHIRPIEEAIRAYHEREMERLQKERNEEKLRARINKINSRNSSG